MKHPVRPLSNMNRVQFLFCFVLFVVFLSRVDLEWSRKFQQALINFRGSGSPHGRDVFSAAAGPDGSSLCLVRLDYAVVPPSSQPNCS